MFKKSIIALFAIMLSFASFASFATVANAQGCTEEGTDSAYAQSRC